MPDPRPIVRRSNDLVPQPTRRPRIRERRLIGPDQSAEQNLVLVDAAAGAQVEVHRVANSESFFVLEGHLRVTGPGFDERLGPGDACLFQPGMEHGVVVEVGPARFLVVFAPARGREGGASG